MAVYGFDSLDVEQLTHPLSGLAKSLDGWRVVFEESLKSISNFLSARDPFEIVAKISSQAIANGAVKAEASLCSCGAT